jgi:hypothetical protein
MAFGDKYTRRDSLGSELRYGSVGIGEEEIGKFPFDAFTFLNPRSNDNPDLYLNGSWYWKRENDSEWTEVSTFTNSWVNYGGDFFNASYIQDPGGFVHLRGVIKSGSVGSSAFTLPTGYRPTSSNGLFVVISNDSVGRVDIDTDGNVIPKSPSNNAYVSLEGIVFCVY